MKTPKEIQAFNISLLTDKGAELETYLDLKILTYESELAKGTFPAVRIFKGNQSNPFIKYYFKSEDRRSECIAGAKNIADERLAWKEEKKAKKATFLRNTKVGDIFATCWGYEQTNCEFYQVTKLVGKCSVEVREIEKTCSQSGTLDMSGSVMPQSGKFTGEPEIKRVDQYGIRFSSYRSAYAWDGTPQLISWYA